ncbi:MAG: prepilin-type N-terminal cleavage/methylation domain-containing protein [Chthoniobacterales bacterium]
MKRIPSNSSRGAGFTLVEVLVSMSVLTILLVLIMQLFSATTTVINLGNKHMDTDAAARALLDRMSMDIGAMVKRSDVDYYLKGRPASNDQKNSDDQLAFYSEVSGYYPSNGSPSPVSLVAYRKNTTSFRLERLGKGLVWNGVSATDTPVVFLPIPLAAPLPIPSPAPSPVAAVYAPAWPQAANMTDDPQGDYEQIGPQVFRFEYYYVLKGQGANASILSDTPWDTRASHTSINGLQDVAAIGVAIAVIDPKSRVLVTDTQLKTLADQMNDFSTTLKPGELEAQWQAAVNASAIPRVAASAIRVYGRTFYLNSPTSAHP